MGWMTVRTADLLNRYVSVRPRRLGVQLVTVTAQSRLLLDQEKGLRRTMGRMAARAILGRWCMGVLAAEACRLVALEAQRALCLPENPWVVRAVGVMARRATLGVGMLMLQIKPEPLRIMAVLAKLRLRLLEPQRTHESMRLVTDGAIGIQDRAVGYRYTLTHFVMTPPAGAFSFESCSPLELGIGACRGHQDEHKGWNDSL